MFFLIRAFLMVSSTESCRAERTYPIRKIRALFAGIYTSAAEKRQEDLT